MTAAAEESRPLSPRGMLSVGYNTLGEMAAKGIVSDRERSYNLWFNPGGYFDRVVYFVPYGRADIRRRLTPKITYVEMAFRRRPGLLMYFEVLRHGATALRTMHRLIREFGIDVIRTGGPNIPAILVGIYRLFRRVPADCFIEAYWENLMPFQTTIPAPVRRILPAWYRLVYRMFEAYCGTPTSDPPYYVRRGMDPTKIWPWGQPMDFTDLGDAVARESVPPAVLALPEPRMVAVGRLHPEKHATDVLKAVIELNRRGKPASLVLVGDGEERGLIEAEAARAGIADRVVIAGLVTQPAGVAIVKACQLYFAPMQGSALVEAMYSGLPIVAYDHATHSDLITHDVTGILVPYRDVEAAVKALTALIDQPQRAKALAAAAQAEAWRRFHPDTMADILNAPLIAAYRGLHNYRDLREVPDLDRLGAA